MEIRGRVFDIYNWDGCGCDACQSQSKIIAPLAESIQAVIDELVMGLEDGERNMPFEDYHTKKTLEMFVGILNCLIDIHAHSMESAAGLSSSMAERFRGIVHFFVSRSAVNAEVHAMLQTMQIPGVASMEISEDGVAPVFPFVVRGPGGPNGGGGGVH